jgi:uncharacterized protein
MPLVNLASLRELERVVGRPLHPLRFRANLYIDGLAPWEEFKWVGHEVAIGEVCLSVRHRCERCEATNVDPETAARDTAIPAVLQRTWGHTDFGVYAKVAAGGIIRTGDGLGVPA